MSTLLPTRRELQGFMRRAQNDSQLGLPEWALNPTEPQSFMWLGIALSA